MSAPTLPSRRRALVQGLKGSLLLSLGPTQLAWGAQVMSVRVWPAKEYTRVTIESDVGLKTRHFLMANPPRLVIDVDGLVLSPQLRELVGKVKADDPFIAGVRVGQTQPRVVRMVVDLKQAIKPQVFGLDPVAAYQHRMVFDLYPTTEVDPKLALQSSPSLKQELSSRSGALSAAQPAASTPPTPPIAASASASTANTLAAASATPAAPAAAVALAPAVALASSVAAGTQGTAQGVADSVNDALGEFITDLRRKPTDRSADKAPERVGDKAADKAVARAPARPPAAARDDASTDGLLGAGGARRLVIVALDPGHGGEDPGAVGPSGLFEKHVALAIALKLRDRINAQPGMRAMLTRDGDFFVPLHDRVRKARLVQADLFMSIHADAFMNPQARGASVFALSEGGASSAAARWMANKENSSDLVGGVNVKAKDAEVMRAMLDMSTTAQIKDSLKLGHAVLGNLGKVGRLHKAHVEQAGFAVLKAPDIPSILVETGFISNPDEETKLQNEGYQHELADALMTGIGRYFAKNPPLARQQAL